MLFIFPAIFHKEDEAYWVEFPDLEGCQTFGDNLSETVEFAQEALSGYLLTLLEEGRTIPDPSEISSLKADGDSFVSLVFCKISGKEAKAVKKTLTIPAWLNDRAVSMGINFSQTLQEALLEKLRS